MLDPQRSHALRSLALLVGTGSTLLACAGDDSGRTSDADPDTTYDAGRLDPSAFIEAFTNLYCDSIGPCCTASGYGHGADECKADLDLRAILGAIELGVPFSEEAAAQCLQDLETWFATCPMTWPLSCKRLLVGSESPGGDCFSAYQCAPPDRGQTVCLGGQCHTITYLAENAPCSGNYIDWTPDVFVYEVCEPPLYCDANGTCRLPPAPGEPCDSTYIHGCRIDAYCSASGSPTCEPRVAIGESCASASCTRDAYCDGSICVALKSAGETCGDDDECFSMSCVAGACLGGSAIMVPLESLLCIQ